MHTQFSRALTLMGTVHTCLVCTTLSTGQVPNPQAMDGNLGTRPHGRRGAVGQPVSKVSSCSPSLTLLPELHPIPSTLHPPFPVHGKTAFHETGPRCQKGWGLLKLSTSYTLSHHTPAGWGVLFWWYTKVTAQCGAGTCPKSQLGGGGGRA